MKDLKEYLNTFTNTTLVTVFPHPDDETIPTGGLLLEAKKLGWETVVICLTKGNAGKTSFKSSEDLSDVRVKEFLAAVYQLGVSRFYILDFPDGKLKDNKSQIEEDLLPLLNEINPGLLVTYDHSGATGHPDHITLSLLVRELLQKINSQPELIWVSFKGLTKRFHKNSKTLKYFTTPDLHLNLSLKSRRQKVKAFLKHKSQIPSLKFKIMFLLYCLLIGESYHTVDTEKVYKYEYVDF